MHKFIRYIGIMVALVGFVGNVGVASAHSIRQNNGYSAVMHIDPDDEPSAHEPNTINFLISRDHGSYNQNDYKITVGIAANKKSLATLRLEPEVFGNAADGVAHYVFPAIDTYAVQLHGVSLTNSADAFTMDFKVRVADNATTIGGSRNASNKTGAQALIFGSSGLVLLIVLAYLAISRGGRYKSKL